MLSFHPRPSDPPTIPPSGPALDVPSANDNPELVPPDDLAVWRDSSLALEQGLDVVEVPIDSLSGELRDSFTPAEPEPGKPAPA